MKTKIIFFSIAVFLYPFSHFSPARAATKNIILSEIQITGGTNRTADDFVELYNPNSSAIDISNYRLRTKNSGGTESSLNKIGSDICMAAHGYYLWANSAGAFSGIADTKTGAGLSSKYSLALLLPEKSENPLIDSVSWESSHPFDEAAFRFSASPQGGESMVRDIKTGQWLPDFSLAPTPTKSLDTSCPVIAPLPAPTPPPSSPSPGARTVRLNEIFPNPKAKDDAGEFIELYNFGREPVDISGWILRDATKTGKYVFPTGTNLVAEGYLFVTDETLKLSLNNSDETVSLFDSADTLVDSVHYETTKEDVSLNFLAGKWQGGQPTPGVSNILNHLPKTKEKVPQKGYRGVAIDFYAGGDDTDHDSLKYTWDFGDGHKSYQEKASHAYKKNGTYAVTLKASDGKDDALETFTIRIQNFPHPKIRITSLMPNPSGRDTGQEWILLKNHEKKTLNLKGYAIATGWKSLVSHRINEDLFIKGKKEAKLTHLASLFTLPNQKGKIELRAPDGQVLQKIKYKLKKPVAEDVAYQKVRGARWTFETAPLKNSLPKSEALALPSDDTASSSDRNGEDVLEAPALDIEDETTLLPETESLGANRLAGEDWLAERMRERLLISLSLWPDARIVERPARLESLVHTSLFRKQSAPQSEIQRIRFSLVEKLLFRINASLNGLFNRVQEE